MDPLLRQTHHCRRSIEPIALPHLHTYWHCSGKTYTDTLHHKTLHTTHRHTTHSILHTTHWHTGILYSYTEHIGAQHSPHLTIEYNTNGTQHDIHHTLQTLNKTLNTCTPVTKMPMTLLSYMGHTKSHFGQPTVDNSVKSRDQGLKR